MTAIIFNRYTKFLIDSGVAALAFYLAFQLRYDGNIPAEEWNRFLTLVAPITVARMLSLALFGMSNHKWRYTSFHDLVRLAAAHMPVTLTLVLLRFTLPTGQLLAVPLGVIAMDFILTVTYCLGVRLMWLVLFQRGRNADVSEAPRKLLLIGAGYHGAKIASELAGRKSLKLVGFLDDDAGKQGARISGLKVLGPVDLLDDTVKKHNVDDVLVCIPPTPRSQARMKAIQNGMTVRVRFMPTVDDVLQADWSPERAPSKSASRNGATAVISNARNWPAPSPIVGKRILITGGAGFIGSTVASRLAERNELTLLDVAFRDKPIDFTGLAQRSGVRLVEGDILDERLLGEVCADADVVIHAAAVLGVSRVCNAARATLDTNYLGTARVLRALESNKHLERFIYFSTSEVFGVHSYRVTEETPSSIGSSAESRWSYAIAKLAGEHLVRSYCREAGLPGVIVRPFNVFGPRRTGDYALLRFMANAVAGKPVEVHGDGSQIRAWCYIDDFCDAIMAMIERPEAVGEDFNIGNPANTVTVHDLARKVIELAGSRSRVEFIDHPHPDISIRVPDLAKAQRLLEYQPRVDLETGLTLTIEWYKQTLRRRSALAAAAASVAVGMKGAG
jgi:nucleoside-diphosphate-sugar epimerase